MDIITEDRRMITVGIDTGKLVEIRTHPEIQLVVIDKKHKTVEAVVGTFRTVEDAEKAIKSYNEALETGSSPFCVNSP